MISKFNKFLHEYKTKCEKFFKKDLNLCRNVGTNIFFPQDLVQSLVQGVSLKSGHTGKNAYFPRTVIFNDIELEY